MKPDLSTDLSTDLVLLSSHLQRCHAAARLAGDDELAAELRRFGFVVASALARAARGEEVRQ